MQREGSAFQGLGVVTFKELSDHLTGVRMIVLEWLVVLMALGVVYTGIQQIREVSAEDPFLFLRLFTRAGEGLPSFVSVLSFLVPLVAIGIGFDLINSERNQRTLSRILAQPIYRDALLFGKFLAGLLTITIMLVALWLMVIGLGILTLGLPPGPEEVTRAVAMSVRDDRLCGRLACACALVFHHLPLGGDRGSGRIGLVAVPHDPVAADLAVSGRPVRVRYGRDSRGIAEPFGRAAGLRPGVARRLVRRDRRRPARSDGALDPAAAPCLAGPGLVQPGSVPGRAAAVAAKHRGGVAADRRHDRRRDPLVCHRLCDLPAAGSPRLALAVRQPLKTVEGGRQAALDAFAVAPFVDTFDPASAQTDAASMRGL